VLALQPAVVVPGHGEPVDHAYARRQRTSSRSCRSWSAPSPPGRSRSTTRSGAPRIRKMRRCPR
jgi:hypothetical protein